MQIINWNKLREKYFKECVYSQPEITNIESRDYDVKTRKIISFAPHDLFEWFKKNLCIENIKIKDLDQDSKEVLTEIILSLTKCKYGWTGEIHEGEMFSYASSSNAQIIRVLKELDAVEIIKDDGFRMVEAEIKNDFIKYLG